jgi:hypothetical protein
MYLTLSPAGLGLLAQHLFKAKILQKLMSVNKSENFYNLWKNPFFLLLQVNPLQRPFYSSLHDFSGLLPECWANCWDAILWANFVHLYLYLSYLAALTILAQTLSRLKIYVAVWGRWGKGERVLENPRKWVGHIRCFLASMTSEQVLRLKKPFVARQC